MWNLTKQWVLLLSLLFMGVIYCSLYVSYTLIGYFSYILIGYCNEHFLQPRVAERHFLDLRKKYGSVLAVDLVNQVHILLFFSCLLVLQNNTSDFVILKAMLHLYMVTWWTFMCVMYLAVSTKTSVVVWHQHSFIRILIDNILLCNVLSYMLLVIWFVN